MPAQNSGATQRVGYIGAVTPSYAYPPPVHSLGPAVALGRDVNWRMLTRTPFGRAVDPGLDLRDRPRVQAILDRIEWNAPGVLHRRPSADRGQLRQRPWAIGETPRFFQVGTRVRSAKPASALGRRVCKLHQNLTSLLD